LGKTFGTAGVRGVFNRTQSPRQVYELAETMAFVLGKGAYGVGWDGRKVSALLARTVISAVSAMGSGALVFGMVPTPVIAYGTRSRSCLAGFSVTASHNPPEFSGVKVFDGSGMELSKADEQRIERAAGVDVMRPSGRFGEVNSDEGIVADYVTDLVSRYKPVSNGLGIAVDCATGPGGLVTPGILRSLGHRVVPVNAQVSWRFPARQPEPTSVSLSEFARIVPGLTVDFGFAHDGDADRLVMVDGLGNMVPDSVTTILALRGLKAVGGTVVISENTSMAVEEEAVKLGFRVLRSVVGKSFAVLKEEGGVFATEPSKVVDPAWGYWEDGINAAAMIAGVIAGQPSLLGELMESIKWRYRQVDLKITIRMSALVRSAREMFKRFKIVEERTLDGYKLVLDDGSWVMFRPSGTEPKTRLYCESKDPQLLDALVQHGILCMESSL